MVAVAAHTTFAQTAAAAAAVTVAAAGMTAGAAAAPPAASAAAVRRAVGASSAPAVATAPVRALRCAARRRSLCRCRLQPQAPLCCPTLLLRLRMLDPRARTASTER